MMRENKQEIDHKYCSQCGAEMIEKEDIFGYDRRTGKPNKLYIWQCRHFDGRKVSNQTDCCSAIHPILYEHLHDRVTRIR